MTQKGLRGLLLHDVGAPPLKGSVEFDASTRQYKITGTGTDIWDVSVEAQAPPGRGQ